MERDCREGVKKIKVMRVITRLNIGGPAINAIILNEELTNGGFETYLITGLPSKDEGDMTPLAKEKGLNITIVPQLCRNIRVWSDIVAFWKIFKIIKKEKPDIVHTHMAKGGALGRLAAILAGVPIRTHTFHGHVFHSYFGAVATQMFIFIERVLARLTDRLIGVSEAGRDDICGRFAIANRSKVAVVRLGLDLGRFKEAANLKGKFRKELNIEERTRLVGIVGRLTAVKNHDLFLEAARRLLRPDGVYTGGGEYERGCNDVKFVIIGDGKLRDRITSRIKEIGLEDAFLLTGWRQDMPEIYADLDVVVLTSLNEGTPLCLIEAMASQKAVVAIAVGGVRDLVEDGKTGLLVKSNDALQVKEAILRLLKDEMLRRRLGEKAGEYVCRIYSKQRLINDMKSLYNELVRTKIYKNCNTTPEE
ncbi:MAG: glycosyltransferase [Candidatus Omnitrophica bacterium]|nr:glycosyltransferase [Candidatus Omnitrophota bacterium]